MKLSSNLFHSFTVFQYFNIHNSLNLYSRFFILKKKKFKRVKLEYYFYLSAIIKAVLLCNLLNSEKFSLYLFYNKGVINLTLAIFSYSKYIQM